MQAKDIVIDIKDLTTGYGAKPIVENINMQVTDGEMVGIIGCNGAGKSTFLKTIRGMLPKLSGSITICHKPVEAMSEKEFATQVAYLQQNVEVGFGFTGLDIVLAGRYPYIKWYEKEQQSDKELALECMRYTGTYELAQRPVSEVSGGQKQRILLAKILAQQTPILFLDEPTTGLDMVYQEEIFRFSKQLVEMGKTVLMVVHELNLAAKYCSRIVLVGNGKILADGTPDEVFTPPLLSLAYHADIDVLKNPATGSIEIVSKVSENKIKQDKLLLHKICKP